MVLLHGCVNSPTLYYNRLQRDLDWVGVLQSIILVHCVDQMNMKWQVCRGLDKTDVFQSQLLSESD